MRKILFIFAVLWAASGQAWGQEGLSPEDIEGGHKLAIIVCGNCHVAASDQPEQPILRPPAPSFPSIMQRKDVTSDWLETL